MLAALFFVLFNSACLACSASQASYSRCPSSVAKKARTSSKMLRVNRSIAQSGYGQQTIEWKNEIGELISYTMYFRLGQYGREFDGSGQPEVVSINGHTGYRTDNSLLWTDEELGFAHDLRAAGNVDLFALAESVAPGRNSNLPTIALQRLPNLAALILFSIVFFLHQFGNMDYSDVDCQKRLIFCAEMGLERAAPVRRLVQKSVRWTLFRQYEVTPDL